MVSKISLGLSLENFGLEKSLGIGLDEIFWSCHSVVKMANNHNYEVEPNPDKERGHEVEPNPDKERGHVSKRPRHETMRRNSQKDTHPRNRQRSPPQKKIFVPKRAAISSKKLNQVMRRRRRVTTERKLKLTM